MLQYLVGRINKDLQINLRCPIMRAGTIAEFMLVKSLKNNT